MMRIDYATYRIKSLVLQPFQYEVPDCLPSGTVSFPPPPISGLILFQTFNGGTL